MKCQQARRLLHEIIEHDVDATEERLVRQHLLMCNECQLAHDSLTKTIEALEFLAMEEAPSDFCSQVMSRLPRQAPFQTLRQSWVRAACTAAVLFLVVASPVYLGRTLSSPQIVAGDRQAVIVQQGSQFVVPDGQVVRGNITVYKGHLVVHGEVQGDVRMVESSLQIGDNGSITGNVSQEAPTAAARLKLAFAELLEDLSSVFFRP